VLEQFQAEQDVSTLSNQLGQLITDNSSIGTNRSSVEDVTKRTELIHATDYEIREGDIRDAGICEMKLLVSLSANTVFSLFKRTWLANSET